MSQEASAFVNMDAEKKASLRHFLSAAMIFSSTWPKEPVTAQQKAHGDAMYARTLAAFDEWFSLHDAPPQPQLQAQGSKNEGDETGGAVARFGWDATKNPPEIIPATNGAFVWYGDYLKLWKSLQATEPQAQGVAKQ